MVYRLRTDSLDSLCGDTLGKRALDLVYNGGLSIEVRLTRLAVRDTPGKRALD